jgi:cell division transport system permease protein
MLKNPLFLPEIADFFKKQPGIDEVNFQKDIVDRLLNLTTLLKKAGIVFFGFLIFMSVIVLTTNTLFKISLKKEEIELLRLLGATRFYIEKPFLLEGSFLAICASVSSFLIISAILFYANPFLNSYLRVINELNFFFAGSRINIWPLNEIFLGVVFVLVTLFGIIIAIFSNLLATNKYLK